MSYQACCKPYLAGVLLAPCAEVLMRSRYTAFVLEDESYLLKTWHSSTRPESLDFSQQPQPKWLGLSIKRYVLIDEKLEVVEFVARYKLNGRAFRLHETSRFESIDGRWFYLDGEIKQQPNNT